MERKILIVGNGTAGRSLAADLRHRGESVVGFLDDRSGGSEVLGRLADVNRVVEENAIDLVYIAIPSSDAKTIRDFINSIESTAVDFGIVPRTYKTLNRESISIDDLTDVDVLDLVGRAPVKHDLVASQQFIAGKRILVTGAAGSIGSRLVQQIVGMDPALVVCVDRWENGIFHLEQKLGFSERVAYRVADVRSRPLMSRIFAEFEPDIVFHAAAYKHVPLMQDNPIEAINNNIGGTLTMMQLAIEHRASSFLFVSTDKAVNPVNVMGATKRIGEMMMEALARGQRHTRFNAVRFGNVIESDGSVMQTFRSQISRKLPLTVTHPDITRFFMTIDEASQLIIQSAMLGNDSEIFVLDMGEPVKIADLARSLVRAVDPALEIVFTGLRPGEKMYEELTYEPERVDRTSNAKIFVVRDEKDFGYAEFLASIESLLGDAMEYRISSADAIQRLRDMGFALQ